MFNIADCTAHVAMVFLYTFGLLYPKAVAILAAFLRFTNISLNTSTKVIFVRRNIRNISLNTLIFVRRNIRNDLQHVHGYYGYNTNRVRLLYYYACLPNKYIQRTVSLRYLKCCIVFNSSKAHVSAYCCYSLLLSYQY